MGKSTTTRFAVGTPDKPYSGIWRFVVSKNDVYIGASKETMGIFKVSLHGDSGVWVLAATAQSGATFENGNRRAKQWNRPLEHAKGITRGPSVVVPHTSLGSRPYKEYERKQVRWFPAPAAGEMVEFSVYFVEPHTDAVFTDDHTLVSATNFENGGEVALLERILPMTPQYQATCEKLLRENVFRAENVGDVRPNSFLWVSQSQDDYQIPFITDLPVNLRPKLEVKDAVHRALSK